MRLVTTIRAGTSTNAPPESPVPLPRATKGIPVDGNSGAPLTSALWSREAPQAAECDDQASDRHSRNSATPDAWQRQHEGGDDGGDPAPALTSRGARPVFRSTQASEPIGVIRCVADTTLTEEGVPGSGCCTVCISPLGVGPRDNSRVEHHPLPSHLRRSAEPHARRVSSPVRAFKSGRRSAAVFDRVKGPYAWDVDGNKYIDYIGSWGPAICGHAHPEVIAALQEAIEKGTSFGPLCPGKHAGGNGD